MMLSLLISLSLPVAVLDAGEAWTVADVEHLMNRAGFGVGEAEARELVVLGREGLVDRLLEGEARPREYYVENVLQSGPSNEDMESTAMMEGRDADELKRTARKERRKRDDAQLADFAAFWVERMQSGEDPLREKMTLFWHGHFASSHKTVKDSYAMIRQHQLFRDHALGSFRDLAHGIVRDVAMIKYLDNDENKKGKPNENLARELMELFTLGEGRYTEADVKEAARALTGWTQKRGEFQRNKKRHDRGEKTVLGVTGPLDGDELVDLLLSQETCAEFLAGELLAWFEGVEPSPARVATYADELRSSDYDVSAFLRRLFNDPAFYEEGVVSNRIAAPIEYIVAGSRRLGVEPPARLVLAASKALGQELFYPPSVKGWDEGEAWITTSSLMLRANLAGVLIGVVAIDDIVTPPADPAIMAMMEEPEGAATQAKAPKRRLGDLQDLKSLRNTKWRPRASLVQRLSGLKKQGDGAIVDALAAELLAVPIDKATRSYLVEEFRARRRAAGVDKGKLLLDPAVAEPLLREFAHVILSLPEAQLN